jgi:serine protease AprX
VTDPGGVQTSTGSNLTAAVYGLQASMTFSAPAAGNWLTTVYGLKGQSTGTVGGGVPDTLHGTIMSYYGTFSGLADVDGSPYAPFIRRAVVRRLMDSADGTNFLPDALLTRGQMAVLVASDCWIRQSQIAPLAFSDVPAALAPYVQAVTTAGGPLRDTFMQAGPVAGGTGLYQPDGTVSRAEVAKWLVRALGKEADAQAAMATVTSYSDDAQIPDGARGYVVVATNIGLMSGFPDTAPYEGAQLTYSFQPKIAISRGAFAVTINRWYDLFMTP